ncbi:hypothetical protein [endosymbiont 'TC1' of Trimyema compressum]|uniref:hypothetical protein n=1 Tax=endosymbiont 'TC1' of Trimyema compressum TaxID=243899 RepID=UPI0013921F31|nr:hypothetical protein [endosymbiont 'TC1' of Trimyema compressum]
MITLLAKLGTKKNNIDAIIKAITRTYNMETKLVFFTGALEKDVSKRNALIHTIFF